MANTKISALTSATTPLAGTEVLPIVQSSATTQVTVANLTAGRAVNVSSLTASTAVNISSATTGITLASWVGGARSLYAYSGASFSGWYDATAGGGNGFGFNSATNNIQVQINNASIGNFTSTGLNSIAIGATTASTGAFSTITASSTITPSQTSGIVGTTTNNSANAGSVGEYVSSQVTSPTTGLTSATATNVTSISLTAGDWDVHGSFLIGPAATTIVTTIIGAISTTSATFPGLGTGYVTYLTVTHPAGNNVGFPVPSIRVSVASTTTVYLVAQATFTISTAGVGGTIYARRRR
jgi:hypothetical protein